MSDATATTFLNELAEELAKYPLTPGRRADILQEVSDLVADGTPVESLGSAADFANALAGAEQEETPEKPELPVDFSGLFDPFARERAWDPENPHIFVPRSFGAGWDINMGALAVRLGILSPDDIDDDVLAAIPSSARQAARLAPAAFATLSALAYLAAKRSGKKLVMNMGVSGDVRSHWGPRGSAVTHLVVPPLVAVWAYASRGQVRDDLNRSAWACLLNTAVAGTALASLTARNDRINPLVSAVAGAVAPFAAQLAAVAIPVRIGRSRVVSAARPEEPPAA